MMVLQTISPEAKKGQYVVLFAPSGYANQPFQSCIGYWDDNAWMTDSERVSDRMAEPLWFTPIPKIPS